MESNNILDKINNPDDLKQISVNELPQLAAEIRQLIIDVASRNGGHLASNLGVVELTIALHYVFDYLQDRIIFDVGHQSYTHKILTGRKNEFNTIRTGGGLSGFTRRRESSCDYTDSGHASTSISIASGFAVSDKLQHKDNHTIVVIGDGSISGGVALEGLNFAGNEELPLLVILNDNEMSISKNVGALSKHIARLTSGRFYQWLTDMYVKAVTKKHGIVKGLFWFAKKFEKGLRIFGDYENIFTNLGFQYIGPIDGHDINELVKIFNKIKKNVNRPVLLHVKTVKGKGFEPAENNPTFFHGVSPWVTKNGNNLSQIIDGKVENKKNNTTFTDVFSEIIIDMAKKHDDVVAITAAMSDGTGLAPFAKEFPTRFFDVGIAEQHAVSFCSGLAYNGLTPVFAVYSTFFTRAIDQVIQDVCISEAPVIFALDRSGIVGQDGETHHGQFDLSLLNVIPNICVFAPADAIEMKLAFDYAYNLHKPVAIRYPKGHALEDSFAQPHLPYSPENMFVCLQQGEKKAIVVVGPYVDKARQINLPDVGLYVLRQIKPLHIDAIKKELRQYEHIVFLEETVFNGSASQEISSLLSDCDIRFDFVCLPDEFICHDSRDKLLEKYGFSTENLLEILKN